MFVQLLKDHIGCKSGERIDVSPDDGAYMVQKGIAQPIEEPTTPLVAKGIEGVIAKMQEAQQLAIDRLVGEVEAAQTLSRKGAIRKIYGENGQQGDPSHCFGHWLICVKSGDAKTLEEEYGSHLADWDNVAQNAALTTVSGPAGGYTVPTEFRDKIMTASAEDAIVRPRATIVPQSARSILVPTLDITQVPASGDTAFFGGVVCRWTEEASTLNETEPQFRQLELTNYELSGYSLLANSYLADNAIGAEKLLPRLFGKAVAWSEDSISRPWCRCCGRARITGAALDVFAAEPPPVDQPLLSLNNVIPTPHWSASAKDGPGEGQGDGGGNAVCSPRPSARACRQCDVLDRPGSRAKLERFKANR